jgi:hypothetical protein
MTRGGRIAIVVLALTGLLAPLVPAGAKGRGPIDVMRPNGDVFTVGPPGVDAWWVDWEKGRCVSCDSPAQAARLHQRARHASLRDAGGPRRIYLLKPRYLQVGWGEAWLFYPTTGEMPSYVVVRGGVGAGDREWDSWQPATERMEQLILSSASSAGSQRQESAARERREPRTVIVTTIVLTVGLITLALVAQIGRSRSRRHAGRTRHWPGLLGSHRIRRTDHPGLASKD